MDKLTDSQFGIDELITLFPFYFCFDDSLCIKHCGPSMLKIEPRLVQGSPLSDFFTITSPRITLDYEALSNRISVLHIWKLSDGTTLKGQILSPAEENLLVFVGAPIIQSTEELINLGLSVNDFAKQDNTLDHLFMLQAQFTTIEDSKRMVDALKRQADENAKLETLQAELSFELNIAFDLKVRFSSTNIILDMQASDTLSIPFDQQKLIGTKLESSFSSLESNIREITPRLEKIGSCLPCHFDVMNNDELRHFNGRLAKAPNNTYLLLADDITEQYQLKLQLEKRANYDALTELPNRSYFYDKASEILSKAPNENSLYALIIIDLDNFKSINDRYGHTAGDFTLKTIAKTLPQHLQHKNVCARIGGDEFAVFIAGELEQTDIVTIANTLSEEYNTVISFQGNEFRCGCSVGIAFSSDSELPIDLFKNQADLAMFHAKNSGKGKVSVYQDGMYEKHQTTLLLRDALYKAIYSHQLTLAYQPVVDVNSQIIGFEALARWQDSERGNIYPDTFIRIAEDAGYMVPLGRVLLREAISTWAKLLSHNQHANDWTLALNISVHQLYDESLIPDLLGALEKHALNTHQIVLEITETAFIDDLEKAIESVKRLKELGFSLALDDFGTGFSSLSYLDRLPFDILKIDRSFVMKIESEDSETPLIDAIVGIAKSMKLSIVAEGVEKQIQKDMLIKMGCDSFQGYYFSKPIPESTLMNLTGNLSHENSN